MIKKVKGDFKTVMAKKIILFGSGAYGLKLLNYFGKDKIYALCDNACQKRSYKYEILYITVEEFLEIYKDYLLILSVNRSNACEIASQLYGKGIYDFLLCNEALFDEMLIYSSDEYFSILNDDVERMKRERNQYIELNRHIKNQFEVLKELSDIRKLRKAKGYLSYIQKETISFVSEIFDYFMQINLGIKPFVAAGTAIGLYRHNGFIPWDDDVDFGLLRNDYMKLMHYGRKNLIYIEGKASFDDEEDYFMEKVFRNHPNEYIMVISPNCLQIKKGTSEINCRTVDFFPYDFYEDGYDFAEHKKVITFCSDYRYTERGNQKILEIIQHNEHIVENSNTIYFGLDSMDSYVCSNEKWMNKDVVLPLVETKFEGVKCYAPNKIEDYLSYCFKDYETYPEDLTCLHFTEITAEKLKKDYVYCGLIVSCEDMVRELLPIYNDIREIGIYCVYLVFDHWLEKSKCDIEKALISEEVEYLDFFDDKMDFLLADDKFNENKVFKNTPIFQVEKIKNREMFRAMIEQLNLSPKKKELVHW